MHGIIRAPIRGLALACVVSGALLPVVLLAAPAAAQLRPFDPLDWNTFDSPHSVSVGIGLGVLHGQILSLAGTRGNLVEMGRFRAWLRSGRITVDAAGTLHRRFVDHATLRAPVGPAAPSDGSARSDAGDIVATTAIRLTAETTPFQTVLRFGTRLPTASDAPGMERDLTDFFASVAGRYRTGRVALGGEAGLGLLGRTRGLNQQDVLTFSAFAESRLGALTVTGSIVGHDDLHRGAVPGNEDLSEARLRLRAGDRTWISATAIRGIARYSPGLGLYVMAGFRH